MRIVNILEHEIRLTEKEYKVLLKRFDLRRVKKIESDGFQPFFLIDHDCICNLHKKDDDDYYTSDCSECPLNVNSETLGCNKIIEEIIGEYEAPTFFFKKIDWYLDEDEEARKNIRKIRKVLKSMKKVK